jgi:hypothetical protein
MMAMYPHSPNNRRISLAGPTDPISDQIATTINNALQGGEPGSPQNKQQVEFFSDVLSLTGQKFVESDKGKKAINNAIYGMIVPLSLVAFAAGWFVGRRKKG